MGEKLNLLVGLPVKCQNDHRAIYWYKLSYNSMDFINIGVKGDENCPCPKALFNQGWARDEGELIIKQETEKLI